MRAVAFHFNVPDRREYACRLLRKAVRAGARLTVLGDEHALADLDRHLWLFDPLEFVPHWRGQAADRLPPRLQETPVLLVQHLGPPGRHPVLVNLGVEIPTGGDRFDRVIEVVGRSESDRAAARLRWRQYTAEGWAIERHEVRA